MKLGPHGHKYMGPTIDHTGGYNRGPKKGCFGTPKNEQKLKVSPRVFLHDGLEMALNVPYGTHSDSSVGPHVLGSGRSPLAMAW